MAMMWYSQFYLRKSLLCCRVTSLIAFPEDKSDTSPSNAREVFKYDIGRLGSSCGCTEVAEEHIANTGGTTSPCPTCSEVLASPCGFVTTSSFFLHTPKSQTLCVKLLAFVLHFDLSPLLPT